VNHTILSPKQLAERIQRPERTIERWRLTGEGPAFIRLGRRIAYRVEDVERWLAGRTFASRAAELARRTAAE
jgi:predicted DNA-binding transcriptional regulator AlpA